MTTNMTSNLPADFIEEEELSPEEQVALAEARDNDMDDDSDDIEVTVEDEELPEEPTN